MPAYVHKRRVGEKRFLKQKGKSAIQVFKIENTGETKKEGFQ